MSLHVFEKVDSFSGGGRPAIPIFGVELQRFDTFPFHAAAQLSLEQSLNQKGEKVHAEHPLNPMSLFEEDGRKLIIGFELREALLNRCLPLVRFEDLFCFEALVVRYQ